MIPVAHIAGIPVEETALSLAPIIATTGGVAGLKLHARIARRGPRKRRRPQLPRRRA